MPGAAAAAAAATALNNARPVAARAGRGLIGVVTAPDPAPAWRSPWQRRAAYAGLCVATVAACAASVATVSGVSGRVTRLPPGKAAAVVQGSWIAPHAQVVTRSGWLFFPGWPAPAWLMALGVLVALVVVAPLPLAARYPLVGWRIGWLALLLVPLSGVRWNAGVWWVDWPWGPVQLLVLLVVFCVAGLRHRRPVLWWMWALTLVPWWLQAARGRPGVLAAALGTVAFTAVAVAVDAMGSRRRAQQALADQAELTELEQARRAVLEERAKIARELHDVVAHHMSLIAVRAETAPYRLAGLPDPVRAEFGSLSGAAREALADMRRLLGVLRHDQSASLGPQPQLADLPALIEASRRAGVAVELSGPAALERVPSAVGVCAYRIVQESLSNASRHAPGAAVSVSVGQDAGAVLLRVANGPGTPGGPAGNGHAPAGPALPPGNGHGPGQGLAGMRERVALLGGSLSVGPAPDGGYVVSAVLPLGEAA
jgi:signal transduction histidine kinase